MERSNRVIPSLCSVDERGLDVCMTYILAATHPRIKSPNLVTGSVFNQKRSVLETEVPCILNQVASKNMALKETNPIRRNCPIFVARLNKRIISSGKQI